MVSDEPAPPWAGALTAETIRSGPTVKGVEAVLLSSCDSVIAPSASALAMMK